MPQIKSSHELAQQIEQLVSDFIAAHKSAATAAVERAFARTTAPASRARPSAVGPRKIAPKRPPDEMATLTERLYAAVAAHPGEPMTVLARAVGVEAGELRVSIAHLKHAGRVRAVGQRQYTRYFPMAKGATKAG
jgi:hypothetical protein